MHKTMIVVAASLALGTATIATATIAVARAAVAESWRWSPLR
jgi:hypothetical protein